MSVTCVPALLSLDEEETKNMHITWLQQYGAGAPDQLYHTGTNALRELRRVVLAQNLKHC